MYTIVLVIHVLVALGVIGLVLLQHGKGADMGAAFGSGASGSLFGVTGASNFMSRSTAILVAIFFATSIALTYLTSHKSNGSIMAHKPQVQAPAEKAKAQDKAKQTPAAPAPEVPK